MAKKRRKPTGFIRVRGRVVPIFGKEGSKRRTGVEGAGKLAAGLGLSIGGGVAAGKLRKRARTLNVRAKTMAQNVKASLSGQMTFSIKGLKGSRGFAGKSTLKALEKTNLTLKKAERASRFTGKTFRKSRLVSASLIGLGVEKLITASGVEKNDMVSELTSEASGVGAAFLADSFSNRAFLKASQGESIRRGLSKDAVKGLKSLGRSIFRRKFKI